jgi:1-aminocyclopropane-1-carboxylate deaminase
MRLGAAGLVTTAPGRSTTMKLHEFDRYPLTFGPSPVHHLRASPSTSAAPRSGPSARTSAAAWPSAATRSASWSTSSRTPRQRRRHPGLDRRLPVQPHPPGRRGRRPPGPEVPSRAGEVGPWDDPVNDKVGNILLSRMMGADSSPRPAGFDIGIRDSWKTPCARSRRRRHPLPDPGRSLRAQARRTGIRQLGVRGRRAGEGPRGLLRHHRRLHRDRLDARRDDRRVCRPRGADRRQAPGHRDRRLRHLGEDPRPGRTHRPAHRRAHRVGRDIRDDEIQVLEGWAGDLYGIPVESTMNAIAWVPNSRR